MQPDTLNLLSDIYQSYLKTNSREYSFSFQDLKIKQQCLNSLDILEEYGYITYTARAMGFCQVKLTIEGIAFAENDFVEPSPISPVYQGANSIYINGSSNTVSDNYNQISVDISNSDLPDECKELIESFLYEMKNPHLSPDKKSEKIKSFLADISSNTISGIAESGLTALLFSLISKISF